MVGQVGDRGEILINPGLVFCRIPHFAREFTIIMGNQMYGHDNGKRWIWHKLNNIGIYTDANDGIDDDDDDND